MTYLHRHSLRAALLAGFAFVLLLTAGLCQNATQVNPAGHKQDDGVVDILIPDLVLLTVTVTDKQDRPITTLTDEDFRVSDDKESHRLDFLCRNDKNDCPVSLVILLDLSNSMRSNPLYDEMKVSLSGLVKQPEVVGESALLGFNNTIQVLANWAHTPEALADALNRPNKVGGYTALYDAMAATLEWLNARKNSRRALIVISDGRDNTSHHSLEQVERLLKQSDITVYSFAISKAAALPDVFAEDGWSVLRRLAAPTAGRFFLPRSPKDVREAFDRIAGELRNQYLIGYWPANLKRDGKWHRAQVNVRPIEMKDPSHPDRPARQVELKVRAREGYFAPKP